MKKVEGWSMGILVSLAAWFLIIHVAIWASKGFAIH